jgi:thiol-disulfide isomerase/thioredoxin
MYDVDAKYLIIIFWEPSCGHCKTELPNLYNYYNELAKDGVDLEVFAMLGDKDTVKWKNFVQENKLTNWINVWDKNWGTNFKIFYNIYSTPTIYLLDENKKIIAKRINSEQVRDFIKAKEFIKE